MLLDPAAAAWPKPDEQVPAAVLVPLFTRADQLHVILTKRRSDLRSHAGEISFPGGRYDDGDADLRDTALREAEEEIGLPRDDVALVGALARTSTFATNYAIHPFVGLIGSSRGWRASPQEVDAVLEPSVEEVRAGSTRTRLERRGFSFQTDAYIVGEHLIWGATARILANLLERVEPLLARRAG